MPQHQQECVTPKTTLFLPCPELSWKHFLNPSQGRTPCLKFFMLSQKLTCENVQELSWFYLQFYLWNRLTCLNIKHLSSQQNLSSRFHRLLLKTSWQSYSLISKNVLIFIVLSLFLCVYTRFIIYAEQNHNKNTCQAKAKKRNPNIFLT